VVPSFLLACVLWADVRDGWAKRVQQRQPNHIALQEAIDDVFGARIGDVSGRGKLAADMREIWLMQPRFDKRVGRAPFGLVEQPRFRAAFDFLRLRADVAEVDPALPDWWQAFSQADDTLRQDMVEQVRIEQQQRRPRPTRARKTPAAPTAAASDLPPNAESDAATAQSPPPKRRRRSRSGASAKALPDASDE
jgi:poly(A) polymerase